MDSIIRREDLASTDISEVSELVSLEPVTPGDVLQCEFMKPLGLSAQKLARELDVPVNRITKIIRGERTVTADTAIRLGRRFATSAEFWLNLQNAHDLELARASMPAAA